MESTSTFQDSNSKCKYRVCCSGYIPGVCFNSNHEQEDVWCNFNMQSRINSCMIETGRKVYPFKKG